MSHALCIESDWLNGYHFPRIDLESSPILSMLKNMATTFGAVVKPSVKRTNIVKAFTNFAKCNRLQFDKEEGEDSNKFFSRLEKQAGLLSTGADEVSANSDEEDDSDLEEDELRYADVQYVTSADKLHEEKKERKSHGFKRFRELPFTVINERRSKEKLPKKTVFVQGNFQVMLLYPWWEISLEIDETGSKNRKAKRLKTPVTARARTDIDMDDNLVYLFLKECKVHKQHLTLLHNFVQRNSLQLSFESLGSVLENVKGDKILATMADNIREHVKNCAQGKLLYCPRILEYCSVLFSSAAIKFLMYVNLEKLQKIDDVINKKPWVLGYRVMMEEIFDLKNIEVKLNGFVNSGLIYEMPGLMKDSLYVYDAMKTITYKEGHTYVTLKQLQDKRYYSSGRGKTSQTMRTENFISALEFLVEKMILDVDRLPDGTDIVMLPNIKEYEESIAQSLSHLMGGNPCIPKDAVISEDFKEDANQLKAANMIVTKPVVVLTGPGGCGKTHVVSKVLSHVVKKSSVAEEQNIEKGATTAENSALAGKEQSKSESLGPPINIAEYKDELVDLECLITAPTGRAASVIGKRGDIEAFTMHHVVYSFMSYRASLSRSGGESVPWKFSKTKILICDECSLISVRLFSMLIGILLKNAELAQVVLLGDIHQLPSIEPGNFLADVFHALSSYSASIRLTKNHRAESELIIKNAGNIRLMEMPVFDDHCGFVSLCVEQEELLESEVTKLLKSPPDHLNDIAKHNGDKKSQFIAFRRKDCELINNFCCKHYNNHVIRDDKGERQFLVGDKLCATKNKEVCDMETKQSVRITNGEIFYLQDDRTVEERGKKTRFWVLDDLERVLKIDFKEVRKLKMRHAYARTIHTYQGSESDIIVYVVGKPYYQTSQHIYTAVTRGRKQVVMVYDQASLLKSVQTPPRNRQTRLRFHLMKSLEQCGIPKEQPHMQRSTLMLPYSLAGASNLKEVGTLKQGSINHCKEPLDFSKCNDNKKPCSLRKDPLDCTNNPYTESVYHKNDYNLFFYSEDDEMFATFDGSLLDQNAKKKPPVNTPLQRDSNFSFCDSDDELLSSIDESLLSPLVRKRQHEATSPSNLLSTKSNVSSSNRCATKLESRFSLNDSDDELLSSNGETDLRPRTKKTCPVDAECDSSLQLCRNGHNTITSAVTTRNISPSLTTCAIKTESYFAADDDEIFASIDESFLI